MPFPLAIAERRDPPVRLSGLLIVNADDWGRERDTTDRTLECALAGTVSSVSAMVFMQDSQRAAALARESCLDVGLHLNFTTAFSDRECPAPVQRGQERTARYLSRNPLAQAFYHPGLAATFRFLVKAQVDEFARLYGTMPMRFDGHHHMHLCANVVHGDLLPADTIVRRNFSFQQGEKSWANRKYRGLIDQAMARRHRLTDYFFPLPPMEPIERLQRIDSLSRDAVVEVETHPVRSDEYAFLASGEIFRKLPEIRIARGFPVPVAQEPKITRKPCLE